MASDIYAYFELFDIMKDVLKCFFCDFLFFSGEFFADHMDGELLILIGVFVDDFDIFVEFMDLPFFVIDLFLEFLNSNFVL